MPTCTSCRRDIPPGTVAARFPCPNCGQEEIWRCSECRRLSNPYACPACGFTGP